MSRPLTPIIVFLNSLVCPFEGCVGLGQIAKLSPDTLAWCAEFGSSNLVAGLPSVSRCTAKYLQLSGGVTLVFAVGCLLMYCQSTFNLSGEVISAFCFGGALIEILSRVLLFGLSSVILLLCRRAAVAGLHCLLPSPSDVLSEYLQFAWGSHFLCLLSRVT